MNIGTSAHLLGLPLTIRRVGAARGSHDVRSLGSPSPPFRQCGQGRCPPDSTPARDALARKRGCAHHRCPHGHAAHARAGSRHGGGPFDIGATAPPLRLLKSPFPRLPRPSPQGTPEVLSYPILRRISSTSESRATPCGGPLGRAAAARRGHTPELAAQKCPKSAFEPRFKG